MGGLGLIRIMAEVYEIQVKGHIDPVWAAYFEGLTLAQQSDGTTLLTGPIIDQPALLGLLMRINSFGLPLLLVKHLGPKGSGNMKEGGCV